MQIVNQALAMSGQPWVPSGNAKPEREIITHAHEKIFSFSQNLRIGIVVMLFITSFFPLGPVARLVNVNPLFAVWRNMLAFGAPCKAAVTESIAWRESLPEWFTCCKTTAKIDYADLCGVFFKLLLLEGIAPHLAHRRATDLIY